MRRTSTLRRRTRLNSSPLRRRMPLARRRARSGPPTLPVSRALERAGYCCEVCGAMVGDVRGLDWSAHHRRPRRAGGSRDPWIHSVANLLIVCGSGTTGCHGVIESHRAAAYAAGWLLPAGADPAAVSVLVVDAFARRACRWVLLTDDGRYAPAPGSGTES